MKLRNKKTGEVQTCDMVVITDEQMDGEIASLNRHTFLFRSVEQFNDEYEAYKPTEPRIDNEEERQCVKLWLKINEIYSVTYHKRRGGGSYLELDNMPMRNGCCIVFQDLIEGLEDGQVYTAAELCGEEEE